MRYIKFLFAKYRIYKQGKKFISKLWELNDILEENGSTLAYDQYCIILDNIMHDYENRENTATFFIDVVDYVSVYLNNPEQFKGNRQIETRVGLMNAIYAILVICMGMQDILEGGDD